VGILAAYVIARGKNLIAAAHAHQFLAEGFGAVGLLGMSGESDDADGEN
jgi:hypothetical protein